MGGAKGWGWLGWGLECRNVIQRGVRGARHSSWTLLSTLSLGGWEGAERGKDADPAGQSLQEHLAGKSASPLQACLIDPASCRAYPEMSFSSPLWWLFLRQGRANTLHTLCLSIRKYWVNSPFPEPTSASSHTCSSDCSQEWGGAGRESKVAGCRITPLALQIGASQTGRTGKSPRKPVHNDG